MSTRSIEPRQPQTRVKHRILDQYIGRWGGIILRGLTHNSRYFSSRVPSHFVYVDCDASFGRYDGELEDHRAGKVTPANVFGSAIIGVQGLDKLIEHARRVHGIHVRTNSILIEKNPVIFAELKKSLELAGYVDRVRETTNFASLKDGEIALVNGDSTIMAQQLVRYTQKSSTTFSLYLIDPWGASGIPLQRFVAPIVSKKRHDVILYMPYYDLHKKSGLITKSRLTDDELSRIADHDAMFDDGGKWRELARDIDAQVLWQPELRFDEIHSAVDIESLAPSRIRLSRQREKELVRHYQAQLESRDPELIVKRIPLPFPDRDQTMYYLYLTTHNADGALAMNELLAEANLLSTELRQRLRDVTRCAGFQGVLFDPSEMQPVAPAPSRPSIDAVANDIYERILAGGRSLISPREIYRAVANEPYFAREVKSAIEYLRKRGKLSYTDERLRNDTSIWTGTR